VRQALGQVLPDGQVEQARHDLVGGRGRPLKNAPLAGGEAGSLSVGKTVGRCIECTQHAR